MHPVAFLDQQGWTKGALASVITHKVCALGALRNATWVDNELTAQRNYTSEELTLFITALQEVTGLDINTDITIRCSIMLINDHTKTTQEQVRTALVKVFGEPL